MDILRILKEKEALLEGHFLLSSGLHSDMYVQCAKLLQYPDIAEKIAKELVKKIISNKPELKIDTVISPAIGGIVIGQEVARVLIVKSIFTERESTIMTLRRGFEIQKGEKCLIVEDVITTGGSTKEVMTVVKSNGGEVVGVASIIDRSDLENFSISLLKLKIQTFRPGACTLCSNNIPLVKPGSKSFK